MQAFAGAMAAREQKDAAGYRTGLEKAVELLPDPSRLLYRLAAARLAAGDRMGAIAAYRSQVDRQHARDPREDPEFAPLLAEPAFREVLDRLDALAKPVVQSTEAFALPVRDLVEGIAYDAKSGAYLFSTVAGRTIWKRTADGKVTEFVPSGAHGLLAALGMAVDAANRLLWVVSAGLPQAEGLKVPDRHKSALIAFDLDSGAWKKTLDAPPGDHAWNDVELAPDGSLFVTDSIGRALLRVRPDNSMVTLLQGEAFLGSPGGLALSADGRSLYVADWNNGIGVFDLAAPDTRGVARWGWMRPPAGTNVLGVDGLRRVGNRLIAIQNGASPPRIQSFELGADGRSLVAAETLERNVPEWDEPTLGVVVDGAFLYVANSHWPSFPGDEAAPTDRSKLAPTSIRRLPLAAAAATTARRE